jgi:hypothetical protein
MNSTPSPFALEHAADDVIRRALEAGVEFIEENLEVLACAFGSPIADLD